MIDPGGCVVWGVVDVVCEVVWGEKICVDNRGGLIGRCGMLDVL
jgi:hypothetical protein